MISPVDSASQDSISFTIDKGETIDSIITRLKSENLVRSKAAMKISITSQGLAKQIQAGEFQLSRSLTAEQIAQTLTVGRSDIKITLIEGWRREEIAQELAKKFESLGSAFDETKFLTLTQGKEGYLFPDTYFLPKQASEEKVVEIMSSTFDKKVDSNLRQLIQKQDLTLDQAVIIASMIEREVKSDVDRPVVAGILLKRWRSNWPLQIDATVQYILGFQKAQNSWWKQDLTLRDLKSISPFNTYEQTGLPPAPICNPSLASIEAVAFQKPSENWFYISDSKGNLHYAKTIEQHNANIAKYLGK